MSRDGGRTADASERRGRAIVPPPSASPTGGILLLGRLVRSGMSATITPPKERTCELCGREERWDDAADGWRIDDDAGSVYCIHEWDINGTFVPLEE
ncbi:hypothetical protein C467_02313 [Halorubrum hochstenium ATCC 700873]|uniref:HEWD domain-containing protein n=2 Tax=Haloferacaceae TaxID=1644056 RepID=M0FKQ1_9EURY|nr:hypothetical protein C467_02313 [Halorubrum hochstenium ATCC 700873]